MGGTGLDSIMPFVGDPIWFSDANGNPAVPPLLPAPAARAIFKKQNFWRAEWTRWRIRGR